MPIDFNFGKSDIDALDALRHTYSSIVKCEENHFGNNEIPFQQYLVLRAITLGLGYCHGPITLTVLANLLDRHANTITSIVDRMEKAGLVRRVKDTRDRRAYRIDLTEEGWEKFKSGTGKISELPQKIFSVLSTEEMEILTRILRKVRDNTYVIRKVKGKTIIIEPER